MEESSNISSSEEKKTDCPVNDDYMSYRLWSAVSFAVMLIVIGIPLWWKTTEVYRASLPYSEIDALDPAKVTIKTNIRIYSEIPSHANAVMDVLSSSFTNLSLFEINIKPFKIDLDPLTYEKVEQATSLHPKTAGEILLVAVKFLPQNARVLVSNHRIIYFTYETESELLANILLDWFFEEDALLDKVSSIVSPQNSQNAEDLRLRASAGYDVIFTVVNSDPENVIFQWDAKKEISGYMKPLLDQISPLSNHYIKSQWLYLIDLGESPRKDESGWFYFKFSQLPHIITPLEKKLGSGISKYPCIHMILYISRCEERPLCFLSEDELRVAGMISPQWGAIQIVNPSDVNCNNHTQLEFSSKEIMSIFISQFHALLGIKEKVPPEGVLISNSTGALLRSWELDSLYRMRTVEQIVSASLSLQSLSKLLGEISNIVINEEVAGSITSAVKSVSTASQTLSRGYLEDALYNSREAHSAAETAFSDPSLLALLYFPDDQKYAVYIPLFLPIMIPVIMSLKRIFLWMSKGT